MKRKILIDCDPGLDDALALLLALSYEDFDVLGVSTIAGNSTLENTTQNALNLLEAFGRRDIPVAQGNRNPILGNFKSGAHVHGFEGLGTVQLPKAQNSIHPLRAHEFIRKILLESPEKVTLIATGPLTNLGLAISLYPEICEHIEMISLMGGSVDMGNVGAVMEANLRNDPEAAHIIFNSGLKIAMFGLNVTYATQTFPAEFDRLEAIGTPLSKMAASFYRDHFKSYAQSSYFKGDPSHDSCAVAYLIQPELFTLEKLNVVIDLSGRYSRGQTIVDRHQVTQRVPNVYVALASNREGFVDLMYKSVKKLSDQLKQTKVEKELP